jgi:hypothetical protein
MRFSKLVLDDLSGGILRKVKEDLISKEGGKVKAIILNFSKTEAKKRKDVYPIFEKEKEKSVMEDLVSNSDEWEILDESDL